MAIKGCFNGVLKLDLPQICKSLHSFLKEDLTAWMKTCQDAIASQQILPEAGRQRINESSNL